MKNFVMGIDFGSTTSKAVVLDLQGNLIAAAVAHKGSVSDEGMKAAMSEALHSASITQDDLARVVSTGYGRNMIDIANKSYTEITCHARGAWQTRPDVQMVIDIGGQDSKVIIIDSNGLVSQFAMNDRCAAGTGKFFEALARAVQIPLEDIGDMALQSKDNIKISSMCATFAETEVISLLASGVSKTEALGAVHDAIASRTVGLVARVGKRTPAMMTGGVAKNPAAVAYIEKALGISLILPPSPQTMGAYGAALFALDEVIARNDNPEAGLETKEIPGSQKPACQTCGPLPGTVVAPVMHIISPINHSALLP